MKAISERMMQMLVDIANVKIIKAKSKTAQALKDEFHLGEPIGRQHFHYTPIDRQQARQWCEKLGIDPATYDPGQRSRAALGSQRFKEKRSGLTIFSEFVCVKPLKGHPEIDGVPLTVPGKGHVTIRPQDVQTVKANALLVVENLETFVQQLDREHLLSLLPRHTLAIFRGSPHFGGNSEVHARTWSQEFSIPRIGFYDYDLSGLIKAAEQNHDSIALPIHKHIEELDLKGNCEDFFRQENEVFLKFPEGTPGWLKLHSAFFSQRGGSFTQERLLDQGVKLQLHRLGDVVHE